MDQALRFFKTESDLPEGGRGEDVRHDHSQANSSPSIGHHAVFCTNELEDVLEKFQDADYSLRNWITKIFNGAYDLWSGSRISMYSI